MVVANLIVATIMYPIQMKTTRIELEGKQKEIVAGSPWCSFTDDNIFDIYKQDVILLKPMNESTIQYYKNMVDIQQIDGAEKRRPSHIDMVDEFSDNLFFIDGNNTFN